MNKLPLAILDGTYFSAGNRRFLVLGAHWVPAEAALQWPIHWDPASIEADFIKMKDLGFNTVRFDLFWAWFEPLPGSYNQQAFDQLDELVRMAHQYQIYLHPTLFIGGEVGEAFWDVPWRHGRHPHADPEMLRLQTDHAAEMARRYRGESAILAWDLTDEPPYWIAGNQTNDAMAINWTRLIAGALRRHDPQHVLCVGTSMADLEHSPFRPDTIRDEVDFFSAHPYSIYMPDLFPDPMVSERGTYCGTFQTLLSAGAGHPVMIHELGASSAQYSPERIAAFDRVTMYSSLAAGSNGYLLWCFTDAAPPTFNRVPYLRAPHETQFGITTWDRKDRPAGEELRRFSRIAEQMNFEGVEPEPAQAGIIVPREWSKAHGDFSDLGMSGPSIIPYTSTQDGGSVTGDPGNHREESNHWLTGAWLNTLILARRAAIKTCFPREKDAWHGLPMLLMPSPLTSTESNLVHVHTDFWEKAHTYVENGGVLYASLCGDAAIPEMSTWFGARLADHIPVGEVRLRTVVPLGSLPAGSTFSYQPQGGNPKHWGALLDLTGGEVIAVDQNGRPALVAHRFGKGRTLLCAYPLESYLALQPAVFEQEENTHRIYQALAEWGDVRPLFVTNHPSVEAAALIGTRRGYLVLANHGTQNMNVVVKSTLPLKKISQLTPDGPKTIQPVDRTLTINVNAYNGAIVEWDAE